MTQVKFIDTTLRDGQQSMRALNMRTGMMMPVIADMDAAGFEAIEFFLPTVQLKKMTRDLGEDPWQWVKSGIERVKKTPLRLHGGYKPHSFSKVPASVGKLLNQKMVEYGITTTLIPGLSQSQATHHVSRPHPGPGVCTDNERDQIPGRRL